ncbi:MAG TPA: bifunctional glycosyltransferase/class I SAM-dependent methyltransferase [Polyangiales bacterium]
MTQNPQRVLVFVIAYEAEASLASVLDRIPRELFEHFHCEILVVDDHSTDRTFDIGAAYRRAHPDVPMVVLRNAVNQGYGGNQKVGYYYAVRNGFDFVAMVHGDGRYAPEELPRLLAPLVAGEADAVFGSRMLTAFGAIEGGMPLYKFVGNRVLSRFQNFALRTTFSEFHSGYRIYSVPALAAVRFDLNTNDFHFDTEIIIQLLQAGRRIVELPIPTYYGNEISRVNGMLYAARVARVTLQAVAHRFGLLYQRRFDPNPSDNTHYSLKLGYASSHTYAIDAVPAGSRVLDLGSGPGGIARELHKKGCTVTVVDARELSEAPSVGVTCVVQDLDEPLEVDAAPFDHILLLDIIEHLRDPERFMDDLRRQFDFEPRTLVVSTPNVAFIVQRFMLLLGQFNYGKAGILDRTHTRLFTFAGLRRLLRDAGFRNLEMRGVPAPFPKVFGNGWLGRAALALNVALIRLLPTWFSYQIFVTAEATPCVDFVLDSARRYRTLPPPP